jgi:hypothetical protein
MDEKTSLLPCATCPWRVDKGADTIPGYVQKKALALRNTVGDGDAFRTVMACHHSTEDAPISCRGYLAQIGWSNITVRMFLAHGNIPPLTKIIAACKKARIKLHRNYGEMMDKLTLSYERQLRRAK